MEVLALIKMALKESFGHFNSKITNLCDIFGLHVRVSLFNKS